MGVLYVTNLGTFASFLNLIHVPNGDFEAHIQNFNLNLNLRRLGCSGRGALTFTPPSDAQKDRFQVFKTLERADFSAVLFELVKLIQLSAYFLGFLAERYEDGLICDETQEAVRLFSEENHLSTTEVSLNSLHLILRVC